MKLLLIAALVLGLSGCATNSSGQSYVRWALLKGD